MPVQKSSFIALPVVFYEPSMKYAVSVSFLIFCAWFSAAQELQLTAVQLRIDPSMYASREAFETRIRRIVESAVEKYSPDLIVFPEYTGVFAAAFSCDTSILANSGGVPDIIENPAEILKLLDPDAVSVGDFFSRHDPSADLDDVFGGAAHEFGVYILGGSYFAAVANIPGKRRRTALKNRAVLYGPDGKRMYEQDKVYLTPFESGLLGLSAGSVDAAAGFSINGVDLGLTICRDTFFKEWEDHFSDADIWIDIKANGVPFDQEQRRVFRQALPARIASSGVAAGVTVCLTGSFLDLAWEGRSSVVVPEEPDGVSTVLKAESAVAQELIPFTYISVE